MYIKRLPLGDVEANCYIICDEETKVGAVLDVGGFSDVLLNEIKEAGIEELKYILCTHGHFDHIAGVKKFKELYLAGEIEFEEDETLSDDELTKGELKGLTWKDIYFDKKVLSVNKQITQLNNRTKFEFSDTKTKDSYRIVPITKVLLNDLKMLYEMDKKEYYRFNDDFKERNLFLWTIILR